MLSPLLTRLRALQRIGVPSTSAPKRTFSQLSDSSRPFFRPSFAMQSPRNEITRRAYNTQPMIYTKASATRAIWLIIGLNTAVFGGWQYAQYNRDHKLLRTLQDNFLLSWKNVQDGRPWVVLTSAFSHMSVTHFAFNMFSFLSFGGMLAGVPGLTGVRMLTLGLGSALAGSAAWLYERQAPATANTVWDRAVASFREGNSALGQASALGASGLVMGVGAAATCFMPQARMFIFFFEAPLWLSMLGFVAIDTYFVGSDLTGIGHSAHLGGVAFGFAYYLLSLRRFGGVLGSSINMTAQDIAEARELTLALGRPKGTDMRAKMLLGLQEKNSVRNGVFRFCDLPAEIRNMIYCLILQHDKHLLIRVIYVVHPPSITFSTAPLQTTQRLGASILAVSRQVHSEAAPILYGANTFDLTESPCNSERCLLEFLKSIGLCRQHLRQIRFSSFSNAAVLRSALHLLKQATHLESFRCVPEAVYKPAKHSSYSNALLPFLKTLQKASRGDKDRKCALEILTFDGPPIFPKSMPERYRQGQLIRWQGEYSKLMAKLRAGLGLEKSTE
ncbi:hypothetical protein LTR17_023315 [Elasticomyces elasticus]|nr:hypothetical protein LTR17_023315 [Elasticomyces elasticus]